MSPQSRVVAVVSDDSLYAPLRYLPLGWELKQFPDVNSLMSHLRAGEYVDGVILADRYTGATLDDVLRHIAKLLLNGIPTALVMYSEKTREQIQAVWPKFEESMRATWTSAIQARTEAGDDLSEDDLISPSDSTHCVLVSHTGGARTLMMSFGPYLKSPFQQEDLAAIDSERYSYPFPLPGDNGFASGEIELGERRGKIVTVISDKGGCGKTTLSLMFAAAAADASAKAGKPLRVVVVDLDRQSQIYALFPGAKKSILGLKPNSTPEQIASTLHVPVPEIPNLSLLVGARDGEDHRALRTIDLYSHLITVLTRDLADLVIIDGSVGVTADPVTMWAQQNSDAVYYVLTEATNELDLAVTAYGGIVRSADLNGVGLDPSRFALIENQFLPGDAQVRKEFEKALASYLPNVPVHGVIPHGGIRVRNAAREIPEGGLLRLAVADPEIGPALKAWVHRLYPDVMYEATSAAASAETSKKKGLFR